MLESVVSNKVNNIGPPFNKHCDVKLSEGTWFETENLKSNSNRSYRKRYYPSTFDKEHINNQNFEGVCKRRREYINKQSDFTFNKHKNFRKPNSDCYRNHTEADRMTRATCCQLRRQNDSRYISSANENDRSGYQRNRSLSQSNVGLCLPHHQLPVDDRSELLRSATTNRRHINHHGLLHQISSHSPHAIIQGKDPLTTSNTINNYCNVPQSQIAQTPSSCGQFPMTNGNSSTFRQPHQTARRRHNTTDLGPMFQATVYSSSTQYLQSRPVNIITSQAPMSACTIANNRTLSTNNNTSPFPLVHTRSFCQHPNQLRFAAAAAAAATYPINPYPSHQQQQHPVFSRPSGPSVTAATNTILPHNSAFCSAVQMPTLIGDVISSTPCHQCAIMATSTGLNTFSNISSMFQFSVAPTAASLITLAAVSGDRIHGSRFSYVPVHAINNWHSQHPYLPAAWSYNDLSSILHNSTARHILQDHLAQRLLSTSQNVGIQFVMMAPSSILGTGDSSQVRHHLIPVSRTDGLSPIAVSRYLPIIDHLPLIDQPKPGITKHELDQIPAKKFVKIDADDSMMEDDKERCMICLDDFKMNEVIRMLRCSHDFHSSCVERWLKINRTCPLCRADAVGLCNRKS